MLKYKIRQFTINYSKTKARDRRAKVNELEEKLQNCTEKCDKDPSKQNVEDLECLQAEYDQLYDYITQGAIVRSRATWYEKGEKNNKYFLNLEKSNKEKSCLRKVLKSDGTIAVNPKSIMSELESFYSNLYKESNRLSSSFLDDLKEFPTLNEDLRIKKFLEDYSSPWKTILDKLLLPVGGRFVLHCNFHSSKLKTNLPAYYKECFDAWSELNGKTPSCYKEIINEIIWNNKFICYDKKSIYRRDIVNLGFMKIGDLISANNSFSYDTSSLINPEQRFFLMSIINSIPTEWRSLIKASTDVTIADPIPSIPTIKMASDYVPILDLSPKQIYQSFKQQKQIEPTAKQKLTNKYSNIEIEWEKVYSLAFQCTLDTKIREFQYKILNCIMFTNEKLNLIGVVESPNCTFCQEATESVEHLLFSCRITSNFWKHVLSWLRDNDVHVGIINEPDVIFGKFDVAEDYILINHILLLGKYYIYSRKCQNSLPTFRGFIARTKRVSNIELHIAREKNKLLFHFQKWEKLINVLNNC